MQSFKLSTAQLICLDSYLGGNFAHLSNPASEEEHKENMKNCGDGILRFMMTELSEVEGCLTADDAVNRMNFAARNLQEMAEALRDSPFQRQRA